MEKFSGRKIFLMRLCMFIMALIISVRGMLRKASANKNSKIPNNRFHKLQCSTFRIKFQRLELLPFNFEIPVIFTQLSVVFSLPLWRVKVEKHSLLLLRPPWLRLEMRKNSFSVILLSGGKNNTFYRSW